MLLLNAFLCLLIFFHPRATFFWFRKKPPNFSSLNSSSSNSPSKSRRWFRSKKSNSSKKKENRDSHDRIHPNPSASELPQGDLTTAAVGKAFLSGWARGKNLPRIERIFRIHPTEEALRGFEYYSETIHQSNGKALICYRCLPATCTSAGDGWFSKIWAEARETVSWSSEWAHEKVVGQARRVMVVYRVVAGRMAYEYEEGRILGVDGGGFDSLIRMNGQDLLVLDPRAILPCFLVVYSINEGDDCIRSQF